MSKRRGLLLIAVLLGAVIARDLAWPAEQRSGAAPGANQAGANAATNITLGLLLPPEESQSAGLRDGAQLAVQQANKTEGAHISLVVRGRVGQWGADAVEAGRMALDDGAAALIAPPDGSATHLALQVSGRTAVPIATLCGDSSVGATGVPWVLRLVPRTIDEAGLLFSNLNTSPRPVKRWVAIVPPQRAGREISADLNRAATNAGCILQKTFEMAPTNRTAVLNQVVKTNADGVLLWVDPASAGICVKVLRLTGFAGVLAGPTRLHSPDFVAAASQALDGFILPGLLLDAGSQIRLDAFETVFRRQFQLEPGISAAFSFDAASVLIHILRETPPENLAKAFPFTGEVAGVTGPLSFDAQGNRKLELQLLQADNGHFMPLLISEGK
jgi:ABC-type branched-subunit amino acid transport system substrate-binding protein